MSSLDHSLLFVFQPRVVVLVFFHNNTIQKHSEGLNKRASLLLTDVCAHRHGRAYQLYIVSVIAETNS